ncbi:hypothetical protein PYCCODRAFT_460154 [Trametes coccinea BRFM310]|uniref:Uncharacterized protein n=1 Tax=Trametes coccinea (strain BRFM310) TaxID=1353009 RepID=A0A1Y2ILF2_TRAC3|nr:hypothetical protein PYCCODRAFT_460154 [Trametes coccinea BRFM310]
MDSGALILGSTRGSDHRMVCGVHGPTRDSARRRGKGTDLISFLRRLGIAILLSISSISYMEARYALIQGGASLCSIARPSDMKEQGRPGGFCETTESRADLKMNEASRRHTAHRRYRMFRMGVDGVERARRSVEPSGRGYSTPAEMPRALDQVSTTPDASEIDCQLSCSCNTDEHTPTLSFAELLVVLDLWQVRGRRLPRCSSQRTRSFRPGPRRLFDRSSFPLHLSVQHAASQTTRWKHGDLSPRLTSTT